MTDIEKHIADQFLPAGLVPVAEEVITLLLREGPDAGDTLITLPLGVMRIESALQVEGGTQLIRAMDLVRVLNLLPFLPPDFSWIIGYEPTP